MNTINNKKSSSALKLPETISPAYIDDLWNRIGNKITKKYSIKDIDEIIHKVRKGVN